MELEIPQETRTCGQGNENNKEKSDHGVIMMMI